MRMHHFGVGSYLRHCVLDFWNGVQWRSERDHQWRDVPAVVKHRDKHHVRTVKMDVERMGRR